MKIVLNLLLVALIAALGYLLYNGIREPIEFRAEKVKRQRVVVDRLMDIREAQELYRDITGKFAGSFDSLVYVLKNDSIPITQVFGDPDDPTNTEFTIKTIYKNAFDSTSKLGLNLDSLRYVPYASQAQFAIAADTMTYQKTLVNVCEVGTRWKEFMGSWADPRYSKYDDSYNPDNMIKFGSLSSPNLSGNWE